MKLNLQPLLKRFTMQPETVKTVGVLVGLLLCACLLVWGIPTLIVHAWNDFFHAMFGLPVFYYDNALALVFWLLLGVGVLFGLKEVK